jgi:hypothetical protein
VAGLRAAIVRMVDDPAARERMGPACRDFAVAEYDIALMVGRYMKLYQELLGGRAAAEDAAPSAPTQRGSAALLETQAS